MVTQMKRRNAHVEMLLDLGVGRATQTAGARWAPTSESCSLAHYPDVYESVFRALAEVGKRVTGVQ